MVNLGFRFMNFMKKSLKKELKKMTRYPPEHHEGLYGTKGVIHGVYATPSGKKIKRTWKPNVQWHDFYSKVLEETLRLKVVVSVLHEIDRQKGFDNYLMYSHDQKLKSRKAIELKNYLLNVKKGKDEGIPLEELKNLYGPKPPISKHVWIPRVYTNRFYYQWKGPHKHVVYC